MISQTKDREEFTNRVGNTFVFECEYPEENPEGAVKDIVDCFEMIGVFDGINQ